MSKLQTREREKYYETQTLSNIRPNINLYQKGETALQSLQKEIKNTQIFYKERKLKKFVIANNANSIATAEKVDNLVARIVRQEKVSMSDIEDIGDNILPLKQIISPANVATFGFDYGNLETIIRPYNQHFLEKRFLNSPSTTLGKTMVNEVWFNLRGATAYCAINLFLDKTNLKALVSDPVMAQYITQSAGMFAFGYFKSNDRSMREKVYKSFAGAVGMLAGSFTGVIVDIFGGGIIGTITGRTVFQITNGIISGMINDAVYFPEAQANIAARILLEQEKQKYVYELFLKEFQKGKTIRDIEKDKILKAKIFFAENRQDFAKFVISTAFSTFFAGSIVSAIISGTSMADMLYYRIFAPIIFKIINMTGIAQISVEWTLRHLENASGRLFSEKQRKFMRAILMRNIVKNITLAQFMRQFGQITITVGIETIITQPNLFISKLEYYLESGKYLAQNNITNLLAEMVNDANTEIISEVGMPSKDDIDNWDKVNISKLAAPDLHHETIVHKFAENINKLIERRDFIESATRIIQSHMKSIRSEFQTWQTSEKSQFLNFEEQLLNDLKFISVLNNDISQLSDNLYKVVDFLNSANRNSEEKTPYILKMITDPELTKKSEAIILKTESIIQNAFSELKKFGGIQIQHYSTSPNIRRPEISQYNKLLNIFSRDSQYGNIAAFLKASGETAVPFVSEFAARIEGLQFQKENDITNDAAYDIVYPELSAQENTEYLQYYDEYKKTRIQFEHLTKNVAQNITSEDFNIQAAREKIADSEYKYIVAQQRLNNYILMKYTRKFSQVNAQNFEQDVFLQTLHRWNTFQHLLSEPFLEKYNLKFVKTAFSEAMAKNETPALNLEHFAGINILIKDITKSFDSFEDRKLFLNAIDKNAVVQNASRSSKSTRHSAMISDLSIVGGGIVSGAVGTTAVTGAIAKVSISSAGTYLPYFGTNILPNLITSDRLLNIFSSENVDEIAFRFASILRNGLASFNSEEAVILAFQDGITDPEMLSHLLNGRILKTLGSGIQDSKAFTLMFWGDGPMRDFILRNFETDPATAGVGSLVSMADSLLDLLR